MRMNTCRNRNRYRAKDHRLPFLPPLSQQGKIEPGGSQVEWIWIKATGEN
jgi:hypothetical protein